MEVSKLQTIIVGQNERLEKDALREAEAIIEQIASKQSLIVRLEREIDTLRNNLLSLEIKQLNSQTVLGQ